VISPRSLRVPGQPLQLLHLSDGDHDRVALDLVLGARDGLGPHLARLVLGQPGLHSTAPVTWPSSLRIAVQEVFGRNCTPSALACSRSSGTIASSSSASRETIVAVPPPSLIALRAASDAVLPPPITRTFSPVRTGRPSPASRRNSKRAGDAAGLAARHVQAAADVLAEGEERRVVVSAGRPR